MAMRPRPRHPTLPLRPHPKYLIPNTSLHHHPDLSSSLSILNTPIRQGEGAAPCEPRPDGTAISDRKTQLFDKDGFEVESFDGFADGIL